MEKYCIHVSKYNNYSSPGALTMTYHNMVILEGIVWRSLFKWPQSYPTFTKIQNTFILIKLQIKYIFFYDKIFYFLSSTVKSPPTDTSKWRKFFCDQRPQASKN